MLDAGSARAHYYVYVLDKEESEVGAAVTCVMHVLPYSTVSRVGPQNNPERLGLTLILRCRQPRSYL